jgi:DNA-binding NarL/FixJ family response regulator
MFNTLLVEDNVSFRRALVDILRTHVPLIGVNEAGYGEEALRKIEQLRPGLIFMDIQLPKENGLEVTREIKLVYHDIVIVVLTSCELSEYRQQAFRNGAYCFLSKQDGSCIEDIPVRVEGTLARKLYH